MALISPVAPESIEASNFFLILALLSFLRSTFSRPVCVALAKTSIMVFIASGSPVAAERPAIPNSFIWFQYCLVRASFGSKGSFMI